MRGEIAREGHAQVADGDKRRQARDRLAHLVHDNWPRMVSHARVVAPYHDEAIAEDIAQDAMVMVLRKDVDLPVPDGRALAFLYRSIRNVGLNRCRRERTRRTESLEQGGCSNPTGSLDPWNEASKIHARRDVRNALKTLSAAEREVMELHGLNGSTFDEVARHRHCSPKTAKELHRRAKRRMYEALHDRYAGPSHAKRTG